MNKAKIKAAHYEAHSRRVALIAGALLLAAAGLVAHNLLLLISP